MSKAKGRRLLYGSAFGVLALIFAISLPQNLFEYNYSPVLYDREGRLLGARVASDGQWRFPETQALNEKFVISLIEAEDRRFYRHIGVDPIAVARALNSNLKEGRVVSGASTLTMQTIRLSRTPRKRTMIEKAVEAVLALRLEIGRSKENIIALYAANAPFGANVVGIEAAAWRWFGRSSLELSWAEAATLAVLPNSPSLIHPGRNRDALRNRRDGLLIRLYERNFFDEETLILSLAEPLPNEPLPLPRLAPHLLDRLVLEEIHGGAFVTTIDRNIQERTMTILNRASERFAANGIMNGAAIVINTQSGEVAAYVGNTDSAHAGAVDIITSRRSSGSLLKPYLYAAMLDSGDILPSSLVSDIPTRVGSFRAENITRTYLGVVPADEALARSLNVPAARSLRTYGVDRFARHLRSLGLNTLFRPGNEYGLPLVLGGAEVTLWEIAGLYAGLGRAVSRNEGEPVFFPPAVFPRENVPPHASLITPGAAWLTLNALVWGVRPGDEAIWQEYASARRIAWKTGTSFGFRDAWAIGVTPEWTIGVWIGNASGAGRPELRSSLTAAPVLFELFSALGTGSNWFFQPAAELHDVEVCVNSGFPAGMHCANVRTADLPRNAPIHRACPYCRTVILNEDLSSRASLEGGAVTVERKWFVLPPAEEWYYRRWNLDYRPLPPEDRPDGNREAVFALFNPEPEGQVYIPRELDGREGRIVFSAAHRDEWGIIHWHLDETYLGFTQNFHEMEARPGPGQRNLTLVDANGNTLVRRFMVLNEVSR